MKKTAFLMAGVAVLALSATAASAQTTRNFRDGQITQNSTVNGVVVAAPTALTNFGVATNVNDATSKWYAAGVSVGDSGTAARFDNATFSLTGAVSTDCAFYTGSSNVLSFDFGQIGVYVSDNTGPAAAFTMVAPASMNFDTNLAGCNTANTVSIQKSDIRGMVNRNGSGYDTAVFQANLPYSVTATYTAPTTNTVTAGSSQTLTVAADVDAARSNQHGAWKSAMDIQVNIPQATSALLAGQYEGNFTVTVAAL